MKTLIIAALVALPALGLHQANGTAEGPPWKLTATRDSFVININGQSMGFAVLAVERLPKGFRVTETTRIGTTIEQTTEILLDAEQRVLSVLQTGKMRGQEARIELRYGNGRVKGSAAMPGPDGPQSHDVDSAVPVDVVDDNLLQTLLGTLPWSADAAYTMPVFSAGRNALTDMKLTVVGTENVMLPGGEVAAYKVAMRGDVVAVNFYVSKAVPQRVLKLQPVGAPFELVRAN